MEEKEIKMEAAMSDVQVRTGWAGTRVRLPLLNLGFKTHPWWCMGQGFYPFGC